MISLVGLAFLFGVGLSAVSRPRWSPRACCYRTRRRRHAPIEGIEGFYIGLVHPLTSPAQVLTLVALGLVFGQRWPHHVGIAPALFAGGCFGGIVLGQTGVPFETAETILLALALLAGALAALWPSSPVAPGLLAAGCAGLLIGLASTPDPGPFSFTAITLAGSFVGATVLLLYSAGGSERSMRR